MSLLLWLIRLLCCLIFYAIQAYIVIVISENKSIIVMLIQRDETGDFVQMFTLLFKVRYTANTVKMTTLVKTTVLIMRAKTTPFLFTLVETLMSRIIAISDIPTNEDILPKLTRNTITRHIPSANILN